MNMLLLIAIVFFSSCAHSTQKNEKFISNSRISWLSKYGEWEVQSANKTHSIARAQSPTRNSEESLRFEIRKNEIWVKSNHASYRSEVSTNDFPSMGAEKWYGFSLYLPADFPIEDNRLILAQWWAKTKKHLGEVSRSPILQLRFAGGDLEVILRWYQDKIVHDDEKYNQVKLYKFKKFPLGQWNDFVFHIKWMPDENGFIETWWNGKKIIDYKGVTENQDEVGPMFKFGLYRDQTDKTYISYFSEYRTGNSYEEVDPAIHE